MINERVEVRDSRGELLTTVTFSMIVTCERCTVEMSENLIGELQCAHCGAVVRLHHRCSVDMNVNR